MRKIWKVFFGVFVTTTSAVVFAYALLGGL